VAAVTATPQLSTLGAAADIAALIRPALTTASTAVSP